MREQLERYRGHEVETAGDSFLATFDGPARAIECAQAVMESAASIGLTLRAGLHTGEVEVTTDGLRGIAVHVAARTMALAEPGEILVTSTSKELVAGSGIALRDRGSVRDEGRSRRAAALRRRALPDYVSTSTMPSGSRTMRRGTVSR